MKAPLLMWVLAPYALVVIAFSAWLHNLRRREASGETGRLWIIEIAWIVAAAVLSPLLLGSFPSIPPPKLSAMVVFAAAVLVVVTNRSRWVSLPLAAAFLCTGSIVFYASLANA